MFPAALAALLLAAPPAPPTLWVEFDGKGGLNPSVPAAGVIAAAGTFTLPPNAEFLGVRLELARRGATDGFTITADTDLTVKPHKWTARREKIEPGMYLVTVKLDFDLKDGKRPDDRSTSFAEGWEIRRVEVPAAPKK